VNDDQATAVLERMCHGKKRLGAKAARRVADAVQATGEDVHAYRCCVCRCWHLGHTPSMATVESIAAAIRERSYPTSTTKAG
jgi:hypothetical protein